MTLGPPRGVGRRWWYVPHRGEHHVSDQIHLDWKQIRAKAGPYPQEAFQFVREGLAHTVKTVHGEGAVPEADPPKGRERHVSGQQLCLGLKDYALHKYGMLARTVLGRWGVRRTDDFGRIVFAMIDAGLMRKSDDDRLDDFRSVYEFDEVFSTAEAPQRSDR
jgi:uncharacterized repeat protein (TIGR04138 family)